MVPPKGDILESDKGEQLSQRLSALHAQLEFLNSYYQFRAEFIDLQRIRRLIGLVQYVNWVHVTGTSADATTGALAETLAKIRPGSDNVSTGIISNSLAQLQSLTRGILAQLKEILDFQRQSYKLMLRRELSATLHQTLGTLYAISADKAYQKLKIAFASTIKGKPFYRDLASELLQEEFGEDGAKLQEVCLHALRIPKEKTAETRPKQDLRIILLEAVRLMLPAGGHLQDSLRKIVNNQEMLEQSRRGFGGIFRSWLQKTFQSHEHRAMVEIRYFDHQTSSTHSESIDFPKFVEGVRRKSSLFAGLSQPDSISFARLSQATEQQIDVFLRRTWESSSCCTEGCRD